MPRGSKPGERRGGRKTGTPNKKTLLRSAFIDAVAADPNVLPLDFFLRLMHQSTLPPNIRVRAAEAALPFMHARPRPTKKPQIAQPEHGDAQPRVKLLRKTDVNPCDLDELHLGPEFQDGATSATIPMAQRCSLGRPSHPKARASPISSNLPCGMMWPSLHRKKAVVNRPHSRALLNPS